MGFGSSFNLTRSPVNDENKRTCNNALRTRPYLYPKLKKKGGTNQLMLTKHARRARKNGTSCVAWAHIAQDRILCSISSIDTWVADTYRSCTCSPCCAIYLRILPYEHMSGVTRGDGVIMSTREVTHRTRSICSFADSAVGR